VKGLLNQSLVCRRPELEFLSIKCNRSSNRGLRFMSSREQDVRAEPSEGDSGNYCVPPEFQPATVDIQRNNPTMIFIYQQNDH
jgi:hypothetical protein